MQSDEKEVFYNEYCPICDYVSKVGTDNGLVEACEECMSTPVNINSHKPVNYKPVKN